MDATRTPISLSAEQFEKLSVWIDAAAGAALSRALEKNRTLIGVAERHYDAAKEQARIALVGPFDA